MPRTRPLRVLVVDDRRDTADSTAGVLAIIGYEVRVTYDGAGALRAVRMFPPDVVLMDIGPPGEGGYAAARGLCAAEVNPPGRGGVARPGSRGATGRPRG
jgi:DNA-binding response OmpR family regulator